MALSRFSLALVVAIVVVCSVYYVHMCGSVLFLLQPFGVLKYGCVAGIMITASHNPKDDNGYKVYWSNGAQVHCKYLYAVYMYI